MPKLEFPKHFYWGAATASHQIEGNQHNDWSEWEKQDAERLACESEGAFHWNPNWQKFKNEAIDPKNYISGIACDSWNRFEEDFDILEKLHLNAYRFSLEWSRIEPKEGEFNEAALAHYHKMITSLRRRNIEPFVTLWHWTLPLWLSEKGGTVSRDFPKYFSRYAEKVATTLGIDVRFWVTLNEPDVVTSHAYLKGAWPPQEKCPRHFLVALLHLAAAHRIAYTAIKNHFPAAQIGIAKHQVYFEMAHPNLINRFLKAIADWGWNTFFLNRIKDHQDFIGLNHYNRNVINYGFGKNPNEIQTDFGWEYHPESLYHAAIELARYGKPIYVTENGIADASDELRKCFIPEALTAIHRAREAGANILGYFYWSLLDNFEWDKGYWLRFGLVQVDHATQARTIRKSAHIYAKIAETNTLDTES